MVLALIAEMLIQLAIGVSVMVIGYLLAPRQHASSEVQNMTDPTAKSGVPIPVIFGEVEVTNVNVLWFGEKGADTYSISV